MKEVYGILEGREVVALGGHTHSSENLREGDLLAGWSRLFGDAGLPFTHITVRAVSGDWYGGRVLDEGYPTSVQRDGSPARRPDPGHQEHRGQGALHRPRRRRNRADGPGPEHPALPRLVRREHHQAPRHGSGPRESAAGLPRRPGRPHLADHQLLDGQHRFHRQGHARRRQGHRGRPHPADCRARARWSAPSGQTRRPSRSSSSTAAASPTAPCTSGGSSCPPTSRPASTPPRSPPPTSTAGVHRDADLRSGGVTPGASASTGPAVRSAGPVPASSTLSRLRHHVPAVGAQSLPGVEVPAG